MAPKDTILLEVASSLEELLDTNLTDAALRNRFRRELFARLDELEQNILTAKKPNGHDLSPSPAEGLYLTPSTLSKVVRWLLPTLIVLGSELWHHVIPLLTQGPHGP